MTTQSEATGVLASLISGKNQSIIDPRTAECFIGQSVDGAGPDVLIVNLDNGMVLSVTVEILAQP